jgi:hypothetical protein
MELEVIVALVSGALGLVGGVIGAVSAWQLSIRQAQSDEALRRIESELADKQAERDARREYEYEAKKRLYEHCEPLVFQLREASERAARRVVSLARTAQDGNLDPGRSWLGGDGYYLRSTTYVLLAPLVIGSLLRRRLTLLDLALEPKMRLHHDAAKLLHKVRTDAFRLAAQDPKLDYDPHHERLEPGHEKVEAVHALQHMMLGQLESAEDAMITRDGTDPLRCVRFSEFERMLEPPSTADDDAKHRARTLRAAMALFTGFHPQRRPALWRVLVAEAHVHRAIASLGDEAADGPDRGSFATRVTSIPKDERGEFAWRRAAPDAADDEVLVVPFRAATRYFKSRSQPRGRVEPTSARAQSA